MDYAPHGEAPEPYNVAMAPSAVIAAALAVLAPPGPESPMAVAKKTNADYRRAMLAKDVAYFEKNAAKDFTYVSQGGTASRAQALAGIKQSFALTKKTERMDMRVVSARRAEGGIVYVTDAKTASEVVVGKKTGKMASAFRFETLLVPRGKGWVYKRVKILMEDTTLDGKPMEMSGG